MPTLVRGYDEALLLRKEIAMKAIELTVGSYKVESFGNGWAYGITCLTTGKTLWVQDESAIQFREDTAELTSPDVIGEYLDTHPHTIADYA